MRPTAGAASPARIFTFAAADPRRPELLRVSDDGSRSESNLARGPSFESLPRGKGGSQSSGGSVTTGMTSMPSSGERRRGGLVRLRDCWQRA